MCPRAFRSVETATPIDRIKNSDQHFYPVSEGGLEGLLPSPPGVYRRARTMAASGVTSTIPHGRASAAPRTIPKPASTPYAPGAGSSSSPNVKPSPRAAAPCHTRRRARWPTPTAAPTSPTASTSGKPRSAMVYGPRTSAVTSDDPLTPTDWPPPCSPFFLGG